MYWQRVATLVGLKLFFSLFVFDFIILYRLPDGSSLKINVLYDVIYLLEALGTVQLLQCGGRAACDLLCSFNDPLKCCPLDHCAAAVQHAYTVCQDALNVAPIKGHQQSLGDVVFPQNPQEVRGVSF